MQSTIIMCSFVKMVNTPNQYVIKHMISGPILMNVAALACGSRL